MIIIKGIIIFVIILLLRSLITKYRLIKNLRHAYDCEVKTRQTLQQSNAFLESKLSITEIKLKAYESYYGRIDV